MSDDLSSKKAELCRVLRRFTRIKSSDRQDRTAKVVYAAARGPDWAGYFRKLEVFGNRCDHGSHEAHEGEVDRDVPIAILEGLIAPGSARSTFGCL